MELLRAIFLTLNQSAIADEVPTAPSVRGYLVPLAAAAVYLSFLLSLMAAFAAMWGKRWLGVDSRSVGKTIIEHCEDRQKKHDEFKTWRSKIYIVSPPLMLCAAIQLLGCGVYINLTAANTNLHYILAPFALIGAFYLLACSLCTGRHANRPTVLLGPEVEAVSHLVAALHSIATAGISFMQASTLVPGNNPPARFVGGDYPPFVPNSPRGAPLTTSPDVAPFS